MEPVVCIDCGFPLGMYYDAFSYMKEILVSDKHNNIHIDKKFIDHDSNVKLIPIFELLNIKKYCCRSQLTACRDMHDLDV